MIKLDELEKYVLEKRLKRIKHLQYASKLIYEANLNYLDVVQILDKVLIEKFYKFLKEYEIDVFEMVEKLNESGARLYEVRDGQIAIYFKDCFYRMIDYNTIKLLFDICGVDYEKT